MTNVARRSLSVYVLIGLLLVQGLSGVAGGIGLALDPSGESVSIPLEWLEGSPFHDYMIPGLILLFVLGMFPLVVVFALFKKKSWSWFSALLVGAALIIWILVEILIIGYHHQPPLQLIYGILGLLILFFVLLPSVRQYFRPE